MKKTLLTLVAMAFGSCVAYAQTTPQAEEPAVSTEQSIETDNMSNNSAEAGSLTLTVEELPEPIQEALKREEFTNYTVLTVKEIQPKADVQPAVVQYEVALQDNAAQATAEPSLVILFDDQGRMASRSDASSNKEEKE